MMNLTFITGAGISIASGIEPYTKIIDNKPVSISSGYSRNDWNDKPNDINAYFNAKAKVIERAFPSDAHFLINALRRYYRVNLITQNIDNLMKSQGLQRLFMFMVKSQDMRLMRNVALGVLHSSIEKAIVCMVLDGVTQFRYMESL